MEHLVESHLGGYYISNSDPEYIEQYCEACGDSDRIITSWDPYEEKGRLNGLLKHFMIDVLNSKKDIDNRVELISDDITEKEEIIQALLNDINYNKEEIETILYNLFEYREISEEEYKKILQISNFEEDRQIKMIRHFEDSIPSKEDKEKQKILKLSNRR